MVRRRNAEDIADPTLPGRASRAMAAAEKMDRSVDGVVVNASQLKFSSNVRPSVAIDPGPAGFNWIEIDLKQTH